MRFVDKELLPGIYQEAFLEAIDAIDSGKEIFSALENLVPKFKLVFGDLSYELTMDWYENLIVLQAKNNYILYVIDGSCQTNEPTAPQIDSTENEKLKAFLEFRKEFYQIIDTYNLKAAWLKKHLFSLLYDMSDAAKIKRKQLSPGSGYSWMVFTGGPFEFNFEPWTISDDSKEYKKAATLAFNQALHDYVSATAKEAKALNYKRVGRPHEIKAHTIWLACKTVKGWSDQQIATEYNVTEEAVKEAIQGLKPYKLALERRRGRPKKGEY